MKRLEMSAAALAAVRLHVSPAHNLAGLLRLGASSARHPWQSAAATRVRRVLTDPRARLVRGLVPAGGTGSLPILHLDTAWGARTWAEELAAISARDESGLAADVARSGVRCPHVRKAAEAGELGSGLADGLAFVWREALADDWPRLERELRAEVARVGDLLATGGLRRALESLHRGVQWVEDEGRVALMLDKPVRQARAVGGEGLVLMPNAFGWGQPLMTGGVRAPGVIYPCRTGDAPAGRDRAPAARLLGTTRARVLESLAAPTTTTELAHRLDLPLSTVSTHLSVLHEAGLLVRRRDGRRVIYGRRSA